MADLQSDPRRGPLGRLFRAHPWHGVSIGLEAPAIVTAYIEIVPSDTLKYELDKESGYLKIDRPQKYSNVCPTLYGLIPQTLCGERVAQRCMERTGRSGVVGDYDPMDICVLSEKQITHSDILLYAIPIGGLGMIDGQEADDKIIAVMENDAVYGRWNDLEQIPVNIVERLRHYFLTYKDAPGVTERLTEITHIYGRDEAQEVIRRSHDDYCEHYGALAQLLASAD